MPKRRAPKPRILSAARASRDGHTYHDMWAARLSLQLLRPDASLHTIAVEGLAPGDAVSEAAEEIADVTLYWGGGSATSADRITLVQFKYSVLRSTKPLTLSELAPTLHKFAEVYRKDRENRAKLAFDLVA